MLEHYSEAYFIRILPYFTLQCVETNEWNKFSVYLGIIWQKVTSAFHQDPINLAPL